MSKLDDVQTKLQVADYCRMFARTGSVFLLVVFVYLIILYWPSLWEDSIELDLVNFVLDGTKAQHFTFRTINFVALLAVFGGFLFSWRNEKLGTIASFIGLGSLFIAGPVSYQYFGLSTPVGFGILVPIGIALLFANSFRLRQKYSIEENCEERTSSLSGRYLVLIHLLAVIILTSQWKAVYISLVYYDRYVPGAHTSELFLKRTDLLPGNFVLSGVRDCEYCVAGSHEKFLNNSDSSLGLDLLLNSPFKHLRTVLPERNDWSFYSPHRNFNLKYDWLGLLLPKAEPPCACSACN